MRSASGASNLSTLFLVAKVHKDIPSGNPQGSPTEIDHRTRLDPQVTKTGVIKYVVQVGSDVLGITIERK